VVNEMFLPFFSLMENSIYLTPNIKIVNFSNEVNALKSSIDETFKFSTA